MMIVENIEALDFDDEPSTTRRRDGPMPSSVRSRLTDVANKPRSVFTSFGGKPVVISATAKAQGEARIAVAPTPRR